VQQYDDLGGKDRGEVHGCVVTGQHGAWLRILGPGDGQEEEKRVHPYKIFLFHGRLVHGGCSYTETHTRVHFYIGQQALKDQLEKEPNFLDTTDAHRGNGPYSLEWEQQLQQQLPLTLGKFQTRPLTEELQI
jgi:hypothetical protein